MYLLSRNFYYGSAGTLQHKTILFIEFRNQENHIMKMQEIRQIAKSFEIKSKFQAFISSVAHDDIKTSCNGKFYFWNNSEKNCSKNSDASNECHSREFSCWGTVARKA